MAIKEGLRTALNLIRETSIEDDTLYHKYIDEVYPDTDIGAWASPILENPNVANEFFDVLIKRIVYTRIETKRFNNPLAQLIGERLPLGAIGQEIAFNPAKARTFNVDDFAGLLAKYDADIKVQYMELNSDLQYCVTATRAKIKDAFISWDNLNSFIDGIVDTLYNGHFIDQYRQSKALVSTAYSSNNVQIEVVDELTTADYAKAFVKKARALYKNFKFPSASYNAWRKVGGYGRDLLTWTNPDDIVILLRTDISTELDVEVLASAFNMDKATLMGRIIDVDNFDIYDGDEKVYDGSAIIGMIADRSWFRIKEQEVVMDEFYNANNRSWQFFLNTVFMYQYSLFANAVVFATEMPEVKATAVAFIDDTSFELKEGSTAKRTVILTPFNSTSEVTFTSSASGVASVEKTGDREVTITGVDANATPATITATVEGTLTDTISVTVVE